MLSKFSQSSKGVIMKKSFVLFLVLLVVFGFKAMAGWHANGVPTDVPNGAPSGVWTNAANVSLWGYVFNGNGITVTSYDFIKGSSDVVIPFMIDGLPVTDIGDGCFNIYDTQNGGWTGRAVTSVAGGENLKRIPSNCFASCGLLTSVNIPLVQIIGSGAFSYCGALTSVSFPNAILIEAGAFFGSGLITASFPQVKTIHDSAFNACGYLSTINIEQVVDLGTYVFHQNSSLTTVKCQNVETIGYQCFMYCSSLARLEIPKVTTIGNWAFGCCPNLTILRMGKNAPAEGEYVFEQSYSAVVYVTDPFAENWGTYWNGKPVIQKIDQVGVPYYGAANDLNMGNYAVWAGSVWAGSVNAGDYSGTITVSGMNVNAASYSQTAPLALNSNGGDVLVSGASSDSTSKLIVAGPARISGYFYFGDPATSGTWRMGEANGDFVVERFNGSYWEVKHTITP